MPATLLTDTSPDALAAAVKANLNALNRYLGRSPYAEVDEVPGYYRWRTAIRHPYFNGVIVSSPPDAAAGERIRGAAAYFLSKGVDAATWWLDPAVPVESWAPVLTEHGLTLDSQLPGMAMALEELADEPAGVAPVLSGVVAKRTPMDIDIKRVEGSATLRTWAETFVAGYGLPRDRAVPFFTLYDSLQGEEAPLRSYMAYRAGVPVATSSVFYAEGVAGIYDVSTLPAARGHGIGAAITLAPLLEARTSGYRVGILQSSSMGLRIYERLGFRAVCQVEHFVWKADGRPPSE
jgi:GNAT superfamily N-acetyltransferase